MALISNFVKHTFITIDKRRSHKKKRGNEYYSKKYQYDNDDVIGCQGSEYTVPRNKLENDYESRDGSETVNRSIVEKNSLPAAKNSLTNEIQEARDKAEKMRADYEEKKAKKEREIIAADENYCELVSKHQEEYGSLEAVLKGSCVYLGWPTRAIGISYLSSHQPSEGQNRC
uniref:Uncharacterized protein n=1 Tax=Plectus sambesii TaxID=2011161 RepID=A0A914X590_9BILA